MRTDTWMNNAVMYGIGGVTSGSGENSCGFNTSMKTQSVHLRLHDLLLENVKVSIKIGYLTRTDSSLMLTQLAKDELIREDGTIDTELAKVGIPQWKRDWYKD